MVTVETETCPKRIHGYFYYITPCTLTWGLSTPASQNLLLQVTTRMHDHCYGQSYGRRYTGSPPRLDGAGGKEINSEVDITFTEFVIATPVTKMASTLKGHQLYTESKSDLDTIYIIMFTLIILGESPIKTSTVYSI